MLHYQHIPLLVVPTFCFVSSSPPLIFHSATIFHWLASFPITPFLLVHLLLKVSSRTSVPLDSGNIARFYALAKYRLPFVPSFLSFYFVPFLSLYPWYPNFTVGCSLWTDFLLFPLPSLAKGLRPLVLPHPGCHPRFTYLQLFLSPVLVACLEELPLGHPDDACLFITPHTSHSCGVSLSFPSSVVGVSSPPPFFFSLRFDPHPAPLCAPFSAPNPTLPFNPQLRWS